MSLDVLAALKGAIDSELRPALKAEGFRRRGDVWTEGDADSGWRLVNVQRWRYNTREKARFTINTTVWPAGTVEIREEVFKQAWGPSPTGEAPFHARPAEVAPDAYGGDGRRRRWWQRERAAGTVDLWWSIDQRTDFAALGRELASFCADRAVPWARERSDGERAATELIERELNVWDLIHALATLERAGSATSASPTPPRDSRRGGGPTRARRRSSPCSRAGAQKRRGRVAADHKPPDEVPAAAEANATARAEPDQGVERSGPPATMEAWPQPTSAGRRKRRAPRP